MDESWLGDLTGLKKVTVNGGAALPQSSWIDFVGGGVTGAYDSARQCIQLTFAASGGATTFGLKEACKCATTTNVTLSGLQTIDGVPGAINARVFVVRQTVESENGIYLMKETAWVRSADADTSAAWPPATIVPVDQGTANADSLWRLTTNAPIVLGVSPLHFERFDGSDARALQGTPIDSTAPTTSKVLVFNGTKWIPGLLSNASIADGAAINPQKLSVGAEFQVVRTLGGVAGWGALSAASLSENIITTASIDATQNNYSPAGWDTATIVRLTSAEDAASRYINGFGPATVKKKLLVNPMNFRPFVFPNQASGQVAGNQIRTPSGQEFVLRPGSSCELFLDVIAGCWWLIGTDPLAYPVLQPHDVPLGSFVPWWNLASQADQFMLHNSSSFTPLGQSLYSVVGSAGARCAWNLTQWEGTITAINISFASGNAPDTDSAMGSNGSFQLFKSEPSGDTMGYGVARKLTSLGSRTALAAIGAYSVEFTGLSIPCDPVMGIGGVLAAVAGNAPGHLNVHRVTAWVQHNRLLPLP
jgi:hypothetical protein